MTERSMFWDGIAVGDCGPYNQSHLMDRFFRALWNGTGDRGVLRFYGNDLEVTGSTSPVSVNTGGAIIYGMFYENDNPLTVSIPTPLAGTRTDTISVRRDWAAQICRVVRTVGPTTTQSPGTLYDIPLARITIDSSGAITTLLDLRTYCAISTSWPNNSFGVGDFEDECVTAAKRPDRTRYIIKGSGSIVPDATNPCTQVAGASYDYWSFAAAAINEAWVYFQVPTGFASGLNFYYWNVPNVNGAGGGAENVKWDYNIYYGNGTGIALTNATGTLNIDQQARLNTTAYRDAIVAAVPAVAGNIIAFQIRRDGAAAADNYADTIRFLGIEAEWTSDS